MKNDLIFASILAMTPSVANVALPEIPKEPPAPTPEMLRNAMERIERAAQKRERKAAKRLRDLNGVANKGEKK